MIAGSDSNIVKGIILAAMQSLFVVDNKKITISHYALCELYNIRL